MSDTLPTVRVKSGDNDFAIINETDFDPSVHELVDGEKLSVNAQAVLQERDALVQAIIDAGGAKPHHFTGVEKLKDILAALRAAKGEPEQALEPEAAVAGADAAPEPAPEAEQPEA